HLRGAVTCEHNFYPATAHITGNNSEFQGAKINDKNFIRLPRQRTSFSGKTPYLKHSLNPLSSDLHLICTFIVTVKIGSDMAFLIG
ncbi:MAG: hypothetical protein VZR06_16265, partial [Butyrivibrio sp.]|nr:hypothetical protein [Butyrivibrio sp.]